MRDEQIGHCRQASPKREQQYAYPFDGFIDAADADAIVITATFCFPSTLKSAGQRTADLVAAAAKTLSFRLQPSQEETVAILHQGTNQHV